MANDPQRFVAAIRKSGLTIYDPITVGDPALWIPTPDLQTLLDAGMHGMSVEGLPNRPRSKAVKERVCQVLGYPVPKSFRQTRPRFPGQMFDTYTQENNNLQVYNEGLDSTRRYVVMQISEAHEISRVKVVTGDVLRQLNLTGTLTRKYQARCNSRADRTELVTAKDTTLLAPFTNPQVDLRQVASPLKNPEAGQLLPIAGLFKRLSKLIGQSFEDAGFNQERKRGAALHGLICEALGYSSCQDDGQFPDVRHQLLEVKLQTSPTIDLGLVLPNSTDSLRRVPTIKGKQVRHCDVRYAVCCGHVEVGRVILTHVFLTRGEGFFGRFPQFQGKILNEKLQIWLPDDFFYR